MPMPAIKICGINSAEALDAALSARAEHFGLVFCAKSPRNVAPDQAAALAARAAGRARVVGLFVDPEPGEVEAVLAQVPLDVVQLHGKEAPALCASIRSATAREVWKAIGVRKREDLHAARAYAGAADFALYDAKPPEGAPLPGGTGLRIDWTLLKGARHPLRWGLAGGLTPENVAEAAAITGAALVDTSSGVESAPGVKDSAKIAAFCKSARGE
ncbi:MAG: phosphoribosylanthranilate isomerase [Sphingomonadales bacterium]|nr:phosphoribosylanthranilate isomerase [Sphingomonadales bacterium]MDE2569432.1 phosphoribosylanthranilate isomerase [Sphingomonadales bacterium]